MEGPVSRPSSSPSTLNEEVRVVAEVDERIGTSSVHDFFEDGGVSLTDQSPPIEASSLSPSSSSGNSNKPGLRPTLKRTLSNLSSHTVFGPQGVIKLSLSDVRHYISAHPSLARAEIVADECYSVRRGTVIHRFLVLQLKRNGKKDIFMRLDRLREGSVGLVKFLWGGSVTKANDEVSLSANKDLLIEGRQPENQQKLDNPPTLERFNVLLDVICEELVLYKLWPENCWFFCSLIQQHLEGKQEGWFETGKAKYPSLARDIRTNVSAKLWNRPSLLAVEPSAHEQDRHDPTLVQNDESSLSVPSVSTTGAPETVVPPSEGTVIERGVRRVGYQRSRTVLEAIEELKKNKALGEDAQKKCGDIAVLMNKLNLPDLPTTPDAPKPGQAEIALAKSLNAKLEDLVTSCSKSIKTASQRHPIIRILREEAVRLQRARIAHDPHATQSRLARLLRNLSLTLHRLKLDAETLAIDAEALELRRAAYAIKPSANRGKLAMQLHTTSLHLAHLKPPRSAEALEREQEAVDLGRKLYEYDPARWEGDLADWLGGLGSRLRDVQRFDDVANAWADVVAIRRAARERAQQNNLGPAVQTKRLAALAGALKRYSTALNDAGQTKRAREVMDEKASLDDVLHRDDGHTSSPRGSPLAAELVEDQEDGGYVINDHEEDDDDSGDDSGSIAASVSADAEQVADSGELERE